MPGGPGNPKLRATEAPGTADAPVDPSQITVCQRCNETFDNWDAFHKHKSQSKKHIVCEICSTDYRTREAHKQHHALMHSAEQYLPCDACSRIFHRMHAFIAHIEEDSCKGVAKRELEKAVRQRTMIRSQHRNARSQQADGRTIAQSSTSPLGQPTIVNVWSRESYDKGQSTGEVEYTKHVQQPLVASQPSPFGSHPNKPAKFDEPKSEFKGDDLMSFSNDEVKNMLNSEWGMPLASSIQSIASEAFPPLPSISANTSDVPTTATKLAPVKQLNIKPTSTSSSSLFQMPNGYKDTSVDNTTAVANSFPRVQTVTDKSTWLSDFAASPNAVSWGTKKLFPDAPPPVAPPVKFMQALALDPKIQDKNLWDTFDPDNPNFNAEVYYIAFIQKYKCPHKGCPKSIAGKSAFTAHLKSAAHKDEKLQCHECLRYFGSVTALTAHSESQGLRCKVRDSERYDDIVDEVTGGTGLLNGTHIDDTIKYAVNSEALNAAGGISSIITKAKEAKAARDNKFNNYWAANKTNW